MWDKWHIGCTTGTRDCWRNPSEATSMKNTTITLTGKLLALPFSAFLALHVGCAGQAPGDTGDDSGDSGDSGDDPDGDGDDTSALDVTGTYQIDSEFDLISSMPGTVGEVSNTFIEMTDDPYDPATWLIDTILAEWDGGVVEDIVEGARPALDAWMHEEMLERAPDIVAQLVDVGDQFGQVTRAFGVNSTLEVAGDSGDGLAATHTAMGYHFSINGSQEAWTLDELERDPVAVEGVGVEFDGSRVSMSEHSIPLQYGGFLDMVLDDVIIPEVNPNASDLGDLFLTLVNCPAIGARVYAELEFGNAGLYEGLCEMGLETGAGFIMDKLVSIDEQAQVRLIINGSARATDSSGDRKIDTLSGGEWAGAIDYAGSMGALLDDANTFSGSRM